MSDLTPPAGEPEYLDSHAGEPISEPSAEPQSRRSRRPFFIAGGAVAALAVAGGAAWAVLSFLSAGPDAAEALPASSTIAFASVNLDPSGEQKIAALNTLKKFPGLKDKLDFDTADDVRKHLFEEIQKDGTCADVDYDKDIKPWLGDRMAVAAIEAGETDPSPVFVVQVTDKDKAEAGVEKLRGCDTSGSDDTGVAFEDGWAVVAETQAIADKVVADTKNGVVSDEDAYKQAMDQAGDSGIVTMYAAPAAGERFLSLIEEQSDLSPFGTDIPSEAKDKFKNFKGAAAVVRFHDGALELEFSADLSGMSAGQDLTTSTHGGDVVSTFPDNTALALGFALPDGWLTKFADGIAPMVSPGQTGEQLLAQIEQETGLSLPEDFETLTGEAMGLAVGSDIDIEKLINSGDPSSLPIGIKVKGDAAKANEVLDKLRAQAGPAAPYISSKGADGYFAVGPDADYLDELLGDGNLGDSATFKDVIPHADKAGALLYVDFDTDSNWLVNALKTAGAPPEVTDNVEPLSALGISGWADGNVLHELIKITTD